MLRRSLFKLGKLFVPSIMFLIMLEIVLQIVFNSLPNALIQRMPQYSVRYGIQYDTDHGAREYPAFEQVDFTIDKASGDLYTLTCLSPNNAPDTEPYTISYKRDDHGFRNEMPWQEDVELVVVGDSFTAAETIQNPFWAGISESTLAFGLPGSGSEEQGLLLEAFGLPRSPEIVVMAYFGGNDIADTWHFHQVRERGRTLYEDANLNRHPWEYLVTFHIALFIRDALWQPAEQSCHYPITDSKENTLAFQENFLLLSTVNENDWQESAMFEPTRQAITKVARNAEAVGATFILMYLPHKAQVHWPDLPEAERLAVSQHVSKFIFDNEKLMVRTASAPAEEIARLLNNNFDAQRHLLAGLAKEHDFMFIDLTPVFQQAAQNGETTYFFGDTHWNQRGHDLARESLQSFLIKNDLLMPSQP